MSTKHSFLGLMTAPSPRAVEVRPHGLARRNISSIDQALSLGFTLLELLIVLVVMGLLMAVVTPQVMNMFSGAKTDTAALQVETLTTALNYYQLDTGAYPEAAQGLEALWRAPTGIARWRGPYVRKRQHLVDPWGKPYRYRFPGKHGKVDVYTLGADDREGGDGENTDVGNWEKQ